MLQLNRSQLKQVKTHANLYVMYSEDLIDAERCLADTLWRQSQNFGHFYKDIGSLKVKISSLKGLIHNEKIQLAKLGIESIEVR